jgi:hypothetical protein
MAAFHFRCPNPACKMEWRKLFNVRPPQPPKCGRCDTDLVFTAKPPTVRSTENLDNGVMARPVERLDDIEAIMNERAAADTRASKVPDDDADM